MGMKQRIKTLRLTIREAVRQANAEGTTAAARACCLETAQEAQRQIDELKKQVAR
jgi:hypothetical protein